MNPLNWLDGPDNLFMNSAEAKQNKNKCKVMKEHGMVYGLSFHLATQHSELTHAQIDEVPP